MSKGEAPSVPMNEIVAKPDQDFFSSRRNNATDHQQEFMKVVATLPNSDDEFTAQDIVNASKQLLKKGVQSQHGKPNAAGTHRTGTRL